ncbi:SDR family NAD(P)-dependent oxidoreductase [Paraburkholderia solisilvae]|uniref:Glucose 1-dehydrogenase 1 n=1 Tax=Paraburkholderia solisilvae TaxID=624376 RepID=A0A6J5DM24_9BURK|nr:glucose 1-dehydrogenase [Paraburkholderia solisilvae]CAB3754222.1 Glucose 1-dehydrogenase 1 [Paraburkholderia solisilvae]
MSSLLNGKVAIVTGAARGIGAAISKRFAAEGAAVSLSYLGRASEAEATLAAIRTAGGSAIVTQADVRKEQDVQRLFAETKARFGRVDIVVNNAAVNHRMTVENITEAEFRNHFDVNVMGILLMVKEATRYLERDGCILNISSLSSMIPSAGASLYGGSKAAVDAITATLAVELGQKGIRVNAINPGITQTEQLDEQPFVTPELRAHVSNMTPLRRLGTPEDIAGAAVALCSPETGWITGQCIRVSGGFR